MRVPTWLISRLLRLPTQQTNKICFQRTTQSPLFSFTISLPMQSLKNVQSSYTTKRLPMIITNIITFKYIPTPNWHALNYTMIYSNTKQKGRNSIQSKLWRKSCLLSLVIFLCVEGTMGLLTDAWACPHLNSCVWCFDWAASSERCLIVLKQSC